MMCLGYNKKGLCAFGKALVHCFWKFVRFQDGPWRCGLIERAVCDDLIQSFGDMVHAICATAVGGKCNQKHPRVALYIFKSITICMLLTSQTYWNPVLINVALLVCLAIMIAEIR
jgi:hypothetical protein